MKIPSAVEKRIAAYAKKLEKYPKLQTMYKNCYAHTLETALVQCEDGSYFVLTGDIPAMWLRDSAAQVTHYLPLAKDAEMAEILEGVIRKQFFYIRTDSYANAFNQTPSGKGHPEDIPKNGPWVHERKYEVDSLCYPIRLLYLYWKESGKDIIIREELEEIVGIILRQWRVEQHHMEASPYRFTRPKEHLYSPWDSIFNDGMGNPVVYTGMTWSGFRPSDDGCEYGYLIASEMFAVVVLGYMSEMLREVCRNFALAAECDTLREEIDAGIRKYGIVTHETYGKIYACETDGMGNYCMIDDANIPSLLSIPYIGYADTNDELYQNTRRFLLSHENPFYFEGKCAKGIGSRHTPENYVWHMALVMQGLTSTSDAEKLEMLEMLLSTDAGSGYLHEGFHVDDPAKFTREWFTWPNSLFAEFIEKCVDAQLLDVRHADKGGIPMQLSPEKMRALEARLHCRFCADGEFAEMAQPLDSYREQTSPIAGVRYGWYDGDLTVLHEAVHAVEKKWVQYFSADSPVFCAYLGEELVSFCQVEETEDSILLGERIGSIGCVGTVPSHRGHGIALRMVDLAALELKRQGMRMSYIHYTAIDHWYKKLGYTVLARFSFSD